jgi:hypothetical protein
MKRNIVGAKSRNGNKKVLVAASNYRPNFWRIAVDTSCRSYAQSVIPTLTFFVFSILSHSYFFV